MGLIPIGQPMETIVLDRGWNQFGTILGTYIFMKLYEHVFQSEHKYV